MKVRVKSEPQYEQILKDQTKCKRFYTLIENADLYGDPVVINYKG